MEMLQGSGLKCPFMKLVSGFSLVDFLSIFREYVLMEDIHTEKACLWNTFVIDRKEEQHR